MSKLQKTRIKIYFSPKEKNGHFDTWFFKQTVTFGDKKYIFDRIFDTSEGAKSFTKSTFYKNKLIELQQIP